MPNPNKSLIAMVIDRSGSMEHLRAETISGANKFIAEQQAVPGECDFTLVTFATDYAFLYNAVPLRDVKPLTPTDYEPANYTALLDAMGRCIDETGKRLSAMPDAERPSKVIFVVMTDGMENSSKEYSRDQIAAKVKHQQERYNWQIVFMGANIDAIAAGGGIGIRAGAAINTTPSPAGIALAYASASNNAASYRGGMSTSMDWSESQRVANDPGIYQPIKPDKP